MTRPPGPFSTGNRLAGDHRLVDRAAALDDLPVDGHLLPRADAEPIADVHLVEGNVLLGSVLAEPAGGLRGESEQGLDGARGLAAGAQLQHLTQEHQRGDHRGGLEVDRDHAAVSAERGRDQAGQERSDQAVGVGRPGAQRNEREHV